MKRIPPIIAILLAGCAHQPVGMVVTRFVETVDRCGPLTCRVTLDDSTEATFEGSRPVPGTMVSCWMDGEQARCREYLP